jgi:hypothetical protein
MLEVLRHGLPVRAHLFHDFFGRPMGMLFFDDFALLLGIKNIRAQGLFGFLAA